MFTRNWLGSPEETDVHETLLGSTLTAEKKEFCAQQELAASKLARSPSHRNLQSQYLLVCVYVCMCARSFARSCVLKIDSLRIADGYVRSCSQNCFFDCSWFVCPFVCAERS